MKYKTLPDTLKCVTCGKTYPLREFPRVDYTKSRARQTSCVACRFGIPSEGFDSPEATNYLNN